ncbi:unannotated protein [freshwater metagenome]|uniref:Unannotated protein n=1 Tax=freshwater metagenome TaxID=449393 RepID=A0A6J6SG35_9ZZZZ
MEIRNPVEPVNELIGHVGERLDERYPRVRHVVIGPLRVAKLDETFRLIDEILESTVVEIRCWQGHGASSAGMT